MALRRMGSLAKQAAQSRIEALNRRARQRK
jgi:hypothetical protein